MASPTVSGASWAKTRSTYPLKIAASYHQSSVTTSRPRSLCLPSWAPKRTASSPSRSTFSKGKIKDAKKDAYKSTEDNLTCSSQSGWNADSCGSFRRNLIPKAGIHSSISFGKDNSQKLSWILALSSGSVLILERAVLELESGCDTNIYISWSSSDEILRHYSQTDDVGNALFLLFHIHYLISIG